MLYRVVTHDGFRSLVESLLAANQVIGPRVVARRPDGSPIHQFKAVESFDELALDYDKTAFSAKTYFLPYRENLCTYRFTAPRDGETGGDWEQEIGYRVKPRAIVGLRACDINALVKLDKVLLKSTFPSPYYLARRKNTFIIGMDHDPCESGFCASVGADIVTHGFDLFLTDLGDRYMVAIDSDRGFRLLDEVDNREVTEGDRQAWFDVRRRIRAGFKTHVNTASLPTVLDLTFESREWDKWGDKCLSCGTCAMVCPTCYCYGVHELASMDLESSRKVKQLHSCNLVDFAEVAGGHNFRPTRQSRLKYRYYHQHRGFAEAHDQPLCVGCNRCGDACLAGINPPAVIEDLQREDLAKPEVSQ